MVYRTHTCWDLNEKNIWEEVIISGWVNSSRDHGWVIFIDLRDRYWICQIKADPATTDPKLMEIAKKIKDEYVIKVRWKVVRRPEGTENPDIPTWMIEIVPEEIEILSEAEHPPFEVAKEHPVWEEIRMKYRYIDLRRPKMKENIIQRHKILHNIFNFLSDKWFLHIETPYLIKNTPEWAREYIVPSRFYPGQAYVLPQSPQQLKQILMVAWMDKYFQIAKCFRDEDLRWDRQPEFTQIDLEMSFVNAEDVINVVEEMLKNVVKELYPNKKLKFDPFLRMTWEEAMNKYWSDKPELRVEWLELIDVSDIAEQSDLKVFKDIVEKGWVVKWLLVDKIFTRWEIDKLTKLLQEKWAKWLAYIIFEWWEAKSPILKFFSDDLKLKLFSHLADKEYSNLEEALKGLEWKTAFFQATSWLEANELLGYLRNLLIKQLELTKWKEDELAFVWVTDFPMFEWDEELWELGAMHHPFTKPKKEYEQFLIDLWKQIKEFRESGWKIKDFWRKNPDLLKKVLEVKADAYDIALNWYEIGWWSIRITNPQLQEAIFEILWLDEKQIEERFGHMLEAFKYWAPPHWGLAIWFDRFVMILQNEPNIRQVIAFPKTQKWEDLMLRTPSKVDEQLLDELWLVVKDLEDEK